MIEQYTPDQFKHDVEIYARYMEIKFRRLRLVGVVQKDRGERYPDPELNKIFVPLRVAVQRVPRLEGPEEIMLEKPALEEKMFDSAEALLKEHPRLALLGDPGSGKSILLRHFAWEHAAAYINGPVEMSSPTPHLLPLYIELRSLTEERRRGNSYDFLQYSGALMQRDSAQFKIDELESLPNMFGHLLEQNVLLLLLDGLDEVATLDERRQLVLEIENFVQYYPAIRVIVTSRPVGYELANLPRNVFAQAQIQSFNPEQIQIFLQNWYKSVLRLDPLPYEDEQELRVLSTALLENTRLHKLAENPLLLTVITALHRYERLPDRRVQVYDRTAELLLDVWAKLKGTDKRWQDIKMSKEDQYACVAYLGLILHERSQEETGIENSPERVDDVPESSLLQLIEKFLSDQKLMADEAEQHIEAERFLELMKVEAGLILERGTNQDGEPLYGFIHRTFQEYFAAISIYNQYQQEESPEIIRHFLKENLHDPHWHEVILLLLGKLLRKPVTTQLRNILLGQTKSKRSAHTELLQQDLFFVCECLTEEIAVESDLVEMVNERLCERILHSPFSAQRTKALDILEALMRTRQYATSAHKALHRLILESSISHLEIKIQACQLLYQMSTEHLEEKREAFDILLGLLHQASIPFDKALDIGMELCLKSDANSEEWRVAVLWLLDQLTNPTHPVQVVKDITIASFILNQTEISRRRFIYLLLDSVRDPDVPLSIVIQIAKSIGTLSIYREDVVSSEEEWRIIHILLDKVQRTITPFEQSLQALEQVIFLTHERRQAIEILLNLVQKPDLTVEQYTQGLFALLKNNSQDAQEYQIALHMCWQLARCSDLSFEQTLQVVSTLYRYSVQNSTERRYAFYVLWQLAQQPALSLENLSKIFDVFYGLRRPGRRYHNDAENKQTTQLLLSLAQQTVIPFGQKIQISQALYRRIPVKTEEYQQVIEWLLDLVRQPEISLEETLQVANTLGRENELSIQMLADLRKHRALSIGEDLRVLLQLYEYGVYYPSVLHEQVVEELLVLVEIMPADVERSIMVAQTFVRARLLLGDTKDKRRVQLDRQLGGDILLKLIESPGLSFEQTLKIMDLIYHHKFLLKKEKRVNRLLWHMTQSQDFTVDQRLQIAMIPFTEGAYNYPDMLRSVKTVLSMLDPKDARLYFEEHLGGLYSRPKPSDIPYAIELIEQDLLPLSLRERLYQLLSPEVPSFNLLEDQQFEDTNSMVI